MWTRARKALTAIFCGQVLLAVGNLVLVPLYLTYWSPEVYGEWLALLALTGYLSTLDLGLNMAATNRMTQAYARHDLEEYARYQHAAFAFYLAMAVAAGILLAGVLWVLPLPAWLGLRETRPEEAAWVIWLLGLNVLFGLPAGFIWSIYRTTGNVSKSQWIWNAQQLLGLGLIPLVLVLNGGMKFIAIGQLAVLVLVTLYVLLGLRRWSPTLVPGLEQATLPVFRGLVQPSLLFGLLILSNAITLHGSVIIVSAMLGGVAVAVFVTSRTLVNVIRQLGGSLVNAMWPEITSMEAQGELEQLRQLHRLLMAGSTALCTGFAAALWFEGAEIIAVWSRGKLDPDPVLLRLLLVLLVLQSTWLVSLVFTAASNRHEKISWSYLTSALIGVGAATFMVRWIGMWAVPVGLLIGEALACYHIVIKETCKLVGEPYPPFARRLWLGLAAVGTLTLWSGWFAHKTILGPPLLRWTGVSTLTFTVSAILTCGVWLTPDERVRLMSRLRLIGLRAG